MLFVGEFQQPPLRQARCQQALLAQAVALMSRADCSSDFFLATAEKFYAVKPSSNTALSLAQVFQNKHDYAKAMTYLNAVSYTHLTLPTNSRV